jgi:hypothetical protein
MATRRGVVGVLGFVGLFIACSVGDVNFDDKACGAGGACGPGYQCDTSRNVCVRGLVGGSAGCRGDKCTCATDADCKEADRSRCGLSKICVECLSESDNCRAGTYCNSSSQCVLGCKQESDCQISPGAPHCNLARHQCVGCRTVADCVGADACSASGECVIGCDLAAGKLCPTGKSCCAGFCLDTTKDVFNCGACDTVCSGANGTPACSGSKCSWTCAAGYMHCQTGNTGCETNVRGDPAHCGSCSNDCATRVVNVDSVICASGSCSYNACTANNDDCDGLRDNGCECTCGTARGERCCPGGVCNAGLSCIVGPNKCN